jgi:hypothetical protein
LYPQSSAGAPTHRRSTSAAYRAAPWPWHLLYTEVAPTFVWHNDLANHLSTYSHQGETELETLTRALALYRNGVLLPAVAVLDGFPEILGRLFTGGFPALPRSAHSPTTRQS